MTKKEIIAALEKANIHHNPKDNKAELLELLEAVGPVPPETETETETEQTICCPNCKHCFTIPANEDLSALSCPLCEGTNLVKTTDK